MKSLCVVVICLASLSCSPLEPSMKEKPSLEQRTDLSRFEETGRRIFENHCAYCHGLSGDGFGLNSPNLEVAPRNLQSDYMGKQTDEELFRVISGGGASVGKSPLMPPWGYRLQERETRALIAYLRTLSRKKPAVTNSKKKEEHWR